MDRKPWEMDGAPGSDIEQPLCVVFVHLFNRYLLGTRAERVLGASTQGAVLRLGGSLGVGWFETASVRRHGTGHRM